MRSKGASIEIQVLGPVRAVDGDRPRDLGGPRQRRLLVALVLADGAPVSVDRLVEAVFGDSASTRAHDTLRSYVTRLRRALASAGEQSVVRDGGGYRLPRGSVDVDAIRFARLVTAARHYGDRGDNGEAVSAWREALSLWRGDAYADLADETWVAPEARRLDEARRSAHEGLADALMAGGDASGAVDSLRDVLSRDLYRESAVGRLMLALYRAGRPVEALETYRAFTHRAADDLGIDPGPALQRLHERLLARDPELEVTAVAPALRGYQLRERLGRGRQGTVHAARMPGVDRDYAIRVYDAEVADDDVTVAMFEADVRLLVSIDEPALLPVYDGWREPGSAALVMRRMAGTLADRLGRSPLTASEATEVVQRVGRALVALARRGRAHGRLEASSVLVDESGRAFLSEPLLGPRPDATPDVAAFVRLARACLTDEAHGWLDDLGAETDTVTVVTEVLERLEAPALVPENPYIGLRPFDEADADRYFGRTQLVAELVARVETQPVVLLVGGSGSGKSSIVRAGLVPHLKSLDPPWVTTVMTPGTRPVEHLTQALRLVSTDGTESGLAAASRRAQGRLLLVVDQMEELFTVSDASERDRFLTLLAGAARQYAGEVHVVATVRADYFDHPLEHPALGEIAARSALAVPPMSAADLEQTVLGPAAGRLGIQDGLVTQLVSAVVGQPGALPALQFTLRALAVRGVTELRLADLTALGGVDGAIAHRAEQMYAALDRPSQQMLRDVLKRLVVVDEAGEPSRRTVPRAELVALTPGADDLVEEWVQGRLLTTGRRPDTREPTVTLAHEAVLTRWPRLREWVDEDRERLLAMARLTQSAQEWTDLGEDPAALPRGGRLEQAELLVGSVVTPPVVQAFVARGQALRTDEHRRAEQAADAERRTSRRLRRQRWMLVVALGVAVAVGWVAIDSRGAAISAAEEQRRRADAGASSLVAASNEAALSDWSRALLLAVEAHRVSPSPATERNLLATLLQQRPAPTTVWTSESSLRSVVVDPRSTWAAVQEAGGPVDVIDLDEGRRVRGAQARGQGGLDLWDRTLVFADVAADVARVRVLDDSGDRVVATVPGGTEIADVEISPDGDQVAVADSSGVVRLLDMGSWEQTRTFVGAPGVAIQQVAWADSARSLHAFDEAGTYLAWDLATSPGSATPAQPSRLRRAAARDALSSIEESVDVNLGVVDLQELPDQGRLSVISTRDGPFWVDIEDMGFEYLVGGWFGRGSPLGGAITDDGGHLVVTGSLMEVHRPQREPFDLRGTAADWDAVDVAVRTDDSVVTVGSDGNVTTWRLPDGAGLPGGERVPALDGAADVIVAPDGRFVLRRDDRTAQVLDGATYASSATLDLGVSGALVLGVAFVPGSDRVVVHACPSPPELEWEPCDSVLTSYAPDRTVAAGPVDAGPSRPSQGTTVVAGSSLLATVDATAAVTVRDPETLEPRDRLRAPDAPENPDQGSLSLSPTGRLLTLTTGQPRSFAVWHVHDGPQLLMHDRAQGADAPSFDGAVPLSDETYVVGQNDALRVFSVEADEPIATIQDPWSEGFFASEVVQRTATSSGVDGLTASPALTSDASLLLTGEPGSYWLWDPSGPLVVAGPITVDSAVLDPTGDRLYLWRGDEAFAMSLLPDDLVAAACEAAGRTLTEQEWSRSIGAGEPYGPACPG